MKLHGIELNVADELQRRRWIQWASQNIPSYEAISEEMEGAALRAAADLRKGSDDERTYQHPTLSLENFIDLLQTILPQYGLSTILVSISSQKVSACFKIHVGHVGLLMRYVATGPGCFGIMSTTLDGDLVICTPNEPIECEFNDSLTIVGWGSLEGVVDEMNDRCKGGSISMRTRELI